MPRVPYRLLFPALGAAWLAASVAAAESAPRPAIPPGYAPAATGDERGLWSELQDYERSLRHSSLRVRAEDLNAYVSRAMCRVAGEYCNDTRVYVIRNPGFNASMTANGIVQVWTGLLMRVASEDELAAVLGHELAHYTQLHSLERMRRVNKAMTTGSIVDMGLFMLGVPVPVGQMAAIANVMAFSRGDESEADLLGVRFMAQAGYDPRAAARVWQTVVAEEERAVAKREKPGVFSQTHPDARARIAKLRGHVAAGFPRAAADDGGRQRHVAILNRHYHFLMEDQIDTNRYGRTEAMLERHRELGVTGSLIDYYLGEMYRQRGEEGDMERAAAAYRRAADGAPPNPEAHHQLGYLHMKAGDKAAARGSFETYLSLRPDSDDRAMIEFYLEDLQ